MSNGDAKDIAHKKEAHLAISTQMYLFLLENPIGPHMT